MNKQTVILVIVSTGLGFIGDVLTYSITESKGKTFGVHVPKGKELFQVLALGILSGIALDYVAKKVQLAIMTVEEREFADLVEKEQAAIGAGQRTGKMPKQVIWA